MKKYEKIFLDVFGEKITTKIFEILETYLECRSCEKLLPREAFHQQKAYTARGGYSPYCKECRSKISKLNKSIATSEAIGIIRREKL